MISLFFSPLIIGGSPGQGFAIIQQEKKTVIIIKKLKGLKSDNDLNFFMIKLPLFPGFMVQSISLIKGMSHNRFKHEENHNQ